MEENTSDLYWWTGDEAQDLWEWRRLIARSGQAAYGKFFGKKAGFVSKEWFPPYIDWSTKIYSVYQKYIAPEDIYPDSIDEVFVDITNYLDTYKMTARELTRTIILDNPKRAARYRGTVTTDRYGRKIPKHATGTENFPYTLLKAATALYDRIVNPNLLIRRLSISANKLLPEADAPKKEAEQLDLFSDYAAKEQREQADKDTHTRERKIQEAMLGIKKRYGKNAILKGMSLEEAATARERNQTIGGHPA